MAVGSKDLSIDNLAELSNENLVEKLRESKEELFNLRFQAVTNQVEERGRIRQVKRDIARIYTVIRERELGIRATPAPVEKPAKKSKATKASKKAEAPAAAPEAENEETK